MSAGEGSGLGAGVGKGRSRKDRHATLYRSARTHYRGLGPAHLELPWAPGHQPLGEDPEPRISQAFSARSVSAVLVLGRPGGEISTLPFPLPASGGGVSSLPLCSLGSHKVPSFACLTAHTPQPLTDLLG